MQAFYLLLALFSFTPTETFNFPAPGDAIEAELVGFCSFLHLSPLTPWPFSFMDPLCNDTYKMCLSSGSYQADLRFECDQSGLISIQTKGIPIPFIPTEIRYLQQLLTLSLILDVDGTVPTQIGLLTHLQHLTISTLGETSLPAETSSLNLTSIILNGFVSNFPDLSGSSSLGVIEIESSVMTGTIPTYLRNFPIASLSLENTLLEGTLPTWFGSLSQLVNLNLRNNSNISGTIPMELGCGSTQLAILQLIQNPKITGTLPPQLGLLKNLGVLILERNGISGTIPMEYGFTKNRFDEKYQWCTQTPPNYNEESSGPSVFFVTNHPGISGTIPTELARIPSLNLWDNALSGTIPVELLRSSSLRDLRVQNNQLEGTLPFFAQTRLRRFSASNNKISGTIPLQLAMNLSTLDVSNNLLTGSLPKIIPKFFKAQGNFFSGTIPYEYCNYPLIAGIYFGGNLTGCYYNCKNLWTANISSACNLSGSTFGCNSLCGAPPSCNAACNNIYNAFPYATVTPDPPPSPPCSTSPPSVHSISSLVNFINDKFNISKTTTWSAFVSVNSSIALVENVTTTFLGSVVFEGSSLNANNSNIQGTTITTIHSSLNLTNQVTVNLTGDWKDEKSDINIEGGGLVLVAQNVNFQSSNLKLTDANLNIITTGDLNWSGKVTMTTKSNILISGPCANFSDANLVVQIPDNYTGTYETILVNSTKNCVIPFKSVSGLGTGCQAVATKQQKYDSAIGVSVEITNGCDSFPVVVVATVGGVAFVAIVITVVILAHPTLKRKVLPFSNRKAHIASLDLGSHPHNPKIDFEVKMMDQ